MECSEEEPKVVTSQPASLSPIPADPAPVVLVAEVTTPLALDDNARLQELYAEIQKIMTKQKLIQSSPLPLSKSEDKKRENDVPEQIAPMQIATNTLSPIVEIVKD